MKNARCGGIDWKDPKQQGGHEVLGHAKISISKACGARCLWFESGLFFMHFGMGSSWDQTTKNFFHHPSHSCSPLPRGPAPPLGPPGSGSSSSRPASTLACHLPSFSKTCHASNPRTSDLSNQRQRSSIWARIYCLQSFSYAFCQHACKRPDSNQRHLAPMLHCHLS